MSEVRGDISGARTEVVRDTLPSVKGDIGTTGVKLASLNTHQGITADCESQPAR